jgi:hypothetical protein
MRADAAALLVSVLALAGTSVAADRFLTGRDIADGSITGADVRGHTVRARDLATTGFRGRPGATGRRGQAGPPGPPGPTLAGRPYLIRDAVVAEDGTVIGGNQPGMDVAHPAPGVYCLHTFENLVQATSLDVDGPMIVAAVAYRRGETPAAPCEPGQSVRVSVFSPGGTPADGAFSVVLS